ncbi:VOC family protein [Dyadobacter aurulentus]|uniref:VOC family protein n=1 Tax=Dyadobacter sp. UC 10 TaxID=2605428 RepID=UPI0011F0F73D|nr:VOC family protein [Dyadobacter sp. UC 10]KAA0990089.1 VOC family protein [Dyadobacter sp. UC 10]
MAGKFLGLRTTIYKVAELDKAKQWYTEAFETAPYFDEPFYVGFNIAGYELGLQQEDGAASAKTANVVTYWGVANAGLEFERLISLGATSHEEPANVGGDIVVASVIDPWGNVIGVIYNPEFTLE